MTETPTHTPLPAISRGPTDELIPCPAGHTGTTRNNNNIYGTWWVQCCKCSWRVAGDTEAEALTAWNTRAVNSHHDLIEALTDVGASLAAAISLLERGGKAAKKAAPSDRMFDQMVKDYKASLERTRAILTKEARHG